MKNSTRVMVIAAAALATSGCTGDDAPTPAPTTTSASPTASPTTSSASPSPSATVAPPPSAMADTDDAAIEFAKWYAVELSRAETIGDPSAIRAFATSDCGYCAKYAELVDEQRRAGMRLEKVASMVEGAELRPFDVAAKVVDVYIHDSETPLVRQDGSTAGTHPAQKITYRMQLIRGGGSWSVFGVTSL